MYPLAQPAAVLPPANLRALRGWPIAMAYQMPWPQLFIVDCRQKRSAAGGSTPSHSSLSQPCVPPPDSSVASKTAAKAIWQRRKKHSMHEQYASVWLDVEC